MVTFKSLQGLISAGDSKTVEFKGEEHAPRGTGSRWAYYVAARA